MSQWLKEPQICLHIGQFPHTAETSKPSWIQPQLQLKMKYFSNIISLFSECKYFFLAKACVGMTEWGFLSVSTADKQASNMVSNVVLLQKKSAKGLLDVVLVIKLCKAVHASSSILCVWCACVWEFYMNGTGSHPAAESERSAWWDAGQKMPQTLGVWGGVIYVIIYVASDSRRDWIGEEGCHEQRCRSPLSQLISVKALCSHV